MPTTVEMNFAVSPEEMAVQKAILKEVIRKHKEVVGNAKTYTEYQQKLKDAGFKSLKDIKDEDN